MTFDCQMYSNIQAVPAASRDCPPTNQSIPSNVPVVPFDMDLYHWDNPKGKAPPINKVWWVPSVDYNDHIYTHITFWILVMCHCVCVICYTLLNWILWIYLIPFILQYVVGTSVLGCRKGYWIMWCKQQQDVICAVLHVWWVGLCRRREHCCSVALSSLQGNLNLWSGRVGHLFPVGDCALAETGLRYQLKHTSTGRRWLYLYT